MPFFATLKQDVVFALRTFAKNRGFALAAAISIGLGIAANTTVFTMVNAVMLGQLPVRDPGRLVSVGDGMSLSWPDYRDYLDGTKGAFDGMAPYFALIPASVGGNGEPERVWGQSVGGTFFGVVGVPMQAGRGIIPDEDSAPGRNPVVVLSNQLWKRRFGADPGIVGRQIRMNNASWTVVGVAANGFHGVVRGLLPDFWVPLSMTDQIMPDLNTGTLTEKREAHWIMVVGRLKSGVSQQQAAAALNVVDQRLNRTYHKGEKRPPIALGSASSLGGQMKTGALAVFVVLSVVVSLVLMIACVNVAGLLLSRATTRQREIGVRLSLGATRSRLVRQLLTESVLLSIAGAVLGFGLAWAAVRAIAGFQLPLPVPVGFAFVPDLRVALFTALVAVTAGILFGIVPALRSTRADMSSWLRNSPAPVGSLRRFGLRNVLVVVQVSASLVLLVCAGLFLRSLQNASSIDLGMRTDGITFMAVDPKLHHYSPEKEKQFVAQLRERVAAVPGVTSVSFVDTLPLSFGGVDFDVSATGKKTDADVYSVGAQYFGTMGIPVLRGREFDAHRDTGNTAILNQDLAKELFPSQDPIGQRITTDSPLGKTSYEVIAVARNTKSRTLGEKAAKCLYLFIEPKPEQAMSFFGISVIARSTFPPGQTEHAVREQIAQLDPALPVFNIETMNEHVNKSMLLPRLCATLLGVFGLVGVALAIIGLYGVINYAARARTKEIGIRMAIGAQPGAILSLIGRDGLMLTGMGVVVGLLLSFAVTRLTESLLYGVSATDTLTFIGVPVLMIAVALVAVAIPARRASRIDPIEALRYE